LGFSREEWLEHPIRWYQQIHPDDKERWAVEATEVFLTGKAIRSCYRVIPRDGHVVWFQCEAKVMLHDDGRPWFIHGIAFDIRELKRTEEALQEERNVASAILDSVGTLVAVLDPRMRIVRFNRVCEGTTGYSFADVRSRFIWDLMTVPEQAERFRNALQEVEDGRPVQDFEVAWESRSGARRLISWSLTLLRGAKGNAAIFHRRRHRRYRSQASGNGRQGSQRPGTAPDRTGLPRRSRAVAHRYRFYEQSSRAAARGKRRAGSRRGV
jgi:PAS domain S-box-containing protein